jgi:hypothetical protein
MTVKNIREALANFKEDEEIYVAVLGKEKAAVFNHITIGENGDAIQLSTFAQDDPDGVTEVAVDVLKEEKKYHEENLKNKH